MIITSYINQFTWTNLLNLVCQCCRRWGTVHDLWRSHTEVPGLSWRELWWIHIEAVRFQCRHLQRWVRRVDHFIVNIVMPEREHTHIIYIDWDAANIFFWIIFFQEDFLYRVSGLWGPSLPAWCHVCSGLPGFWQEWEWISFMQWVYLFYSHAMWENHRSVTLPLRNFIIIYFDLLKL